MSTLYRAQILLEEEQHQALAEIAHTDGRSVSGLVREIVDEYLAERLQDARSQRQMQAIEALTEMRRELQEQHGIYQGDLLAEVRAEREQDVERAWRNEE